MTLRRNILALLGIAISIGGLLVGLSGLEHWLALAPGLDGRAQVPLSLALLLIVLGIVIILAGIACLYIALFRGPRADAEAPTTRDPHSPEVPNL